MLIFACFPKSWEAPSGPLLWCAWWVILNKKCAFRPFLTYVCNPEHIGLSRPGAKRAWISFRWNRKEKMRSRGLKKVKGKPGAAGAGLEAGCRPTPKCQKLGQNSLFFFGKVVSGCTRPAKTTTPVQPLSSSPAPPLLRVPPAERFATGQRKNSERQNI